MRVYWWTAMTCQKAHASTSKPGRELFLRAACGRSVFMAGYPPIVPGKLMRCKQCVRATNPKGTE